VAHPPENGGRPDWVGVNARHAYGAGKEEDGCGFLGGFSGFHEPCGSSGTLDVTRNACYFVRVIVSYRDKRTREFAGGERVKAFSGMERSARLKLDRLEAATSLADLAALPGNRFEALHGDRRGQYSIRINDQWRVCFEWPSGSPGPSNVEIVDYH